MAGAALNSQTFSHKLMRVGVTGLMVAGALLLAAIFFRSSRLAVTILLMAVAYAVGTVHKRNATSESGSGAERKRDAVQVESKSNSSIDNMIKSISETFAGEKRALIKRNHQLLSLCELSNSAGPPQRLNDYLSGVLTEIVRIFAARVAEITLIGSPEDTIAMYCRDREIIAVHRGAAAPRISRGLTARVIKSGKPQIERINLRDSRELDDIRFKGIGQLAAFPIKTRNRIVGTILLALSSRAVISKDDMELLSAIGLMAGGAVENNRLYRKVKRISDTDRITGLYNHRFIRKKLAVEIRRAARYNRSLCLLMLDVDDFKEINDSFGRSFGDTALKKIASAVSAACRETDIVGRCGGDEFLLILPETHAESAVAVGDRVRRHIRNLSLYPAKGVSKCVNLTASLGIAVYPQSGKTSSELIAAADKSLDLSKWAGGDEASGRSCVS